MTMLLNFYKRTGAAFICTLLMMNISYGQGDPNILVELENFDPTFESSETTGLWGGSSVVSNNANSGTNAARLDDNSQWGGGLELEITGLSSSTTYEFSAYVKNSVSGESGSILARDFGSENVSSSFTNTSYEQVSITFVTGLSATSATIAVYNGVGGNGVIYVDDVSLTDMGPGNPATLEELSETEYELVWSDEFNEDGSIDDSAWSAERGFKRNNEAQYYHPDNLTQKDGNLVISATRERYANEEYDRNSNNWRFNRQYANWTSGSINTIGKVSFLYGRVECRAKVTNLTGTWPAIWTVGTVDATQEFADESFMTGCQSSDWPAGGEIDIMENYGGGILGNFAVAARGRWSAKWDARKVNVSSFGDPDWADKYHVWTLDWTEESMKIYVDGIFINEMSTSVANESDAYACPGSAPFKNTPQALWLNLALGGNAGGSTRNLPDSTVYLVDYIRVYQLGDSESSTATNLIDNSGFETGTSNHLWGGSRVVSNNANSGSYSARLEDNSEWGGGYEHVVTGLSSNTTYTFSAYVKSNGNEGRVGVKEYGGTSVYTSFSNSSYERVSIEFTTGANNTSATVYVYNPRGGASTLYADDLELVEGGLSSSRLSLSQESVFEEVADANRLVSVAPNPATNGIVSLTITDSGDYDYAILSMNGKMIISGQANKGNNRLDVSSLKPGLYMLRLSSDTFNDILRFVIAK